MTTQKTEDAGRVVDTGAPLSELSRLSPDERADDVVNPHEYVLARRSITSLEDLEGPRQPAVDVRPDGQAIINEPVPTVPDPAYSDDAAEHAPLAKQADQRGRKSSAK